MHTLEKAPPHWIFCWERWVRAVVCCGTHPHVGHTLTEGQTHRRFHGAPHYWVVDGFPIEPVTHELAVRRPQYTTAGMPGTCRGRGAHWMAPDRLRAPRVMLVTSTCVRVNMKSPAMSHSGPNAPPRPGGSARRPSGGQPHRSALLCQPSQGHLRLVGGLGRAGARPRAPAAGLQRGAARPAAGGGGGGGGGGAAPTAGAGRLVGALGRASSAGTWPPLLCVIVC